MTIQEAAYGFAQRVVQVAVNAEFENLREDMVTTMVMKQYFGDPKVPAVVRLGEAVGVIQLLAATVETMADEIAGKPR